MAQFYISNKMWNVVEDSKSEPITAEEIKKNDRNNAIVMKFIKLGVNSDFYINVIKK